MRRYVLGTLAVAAALWLGLFWLSLAPAAALEIDLIDDVVEAAIPTPPHWLFGGPPTLADAARMIDHIQASLVNQGTVVVKQPDVWGQARMTKFRKEFEDTMAQELTRFQALLNARIARSDAAALQSQTSLAASLTPLAPGQSLTLPNSAAVTSELTAATNLLGTNSTLPLPSPTAPAPGAAVAQNFSLLTALTPVAGSSAPPGTNMAFGLEPNINVDERADYITHLQRLRRINLGDDNADSAGYGLYLMRVPVAIQPGDKTKKGFGALVNMTVRHDFAPRFLPSTYRNLVINDLIDQLTPVVYALIKTGQAARYYAAVNVRLDASRTNKQPQSGEAGDLAAYATAARDTLPTGTNLLAIAGNALRFPINRSGQRVYPIAPSDVYRVFVIQNLLNLSYEAQAALGLVVISDASKSKTVNPAPPNPKDVRMTDIRSYLRNELEAAYDLMDGRCRTEQPFLQDVQYIESLTDQVYCRKFEGPRGARVNTDEELNEFYTLYESFTRRLPGNLRFRGIGVLCWGIALEAGLLNRQLQADMAEAKGADGATLPPGYMAMAFYQPMPPPEVEAMFEQYVRTRWPMITFALEPVTDQQNIDDAFTRRRDLQLAIAFALAAGRLSFSQAIQYTRQLQYESQTIALNQTVAAIAHGNDTFGWRISPRYQTPPEESNLRAITNLLLRGGPGPNYQLAQSKIEPGLRELTAVVVMPSFVRGIRIDVMNNWYRLCDPDERKLRTARAVEIGRRINEARDVLEAACKCARYRPDDVERLRVRLYQLEQMLPLQTQYVKVPYENSLGGFALFTPGASALVPELSGFEGIDAIDPAAGCDLIVYGKHFGIYESAVVVGGKALPREGTSTIVAKDAGGNAVTVVSTVGDVGSYDIISREVMRVRIPKGVTPTRLPDGTVAVELYVGTPNGISNRLQIPVATPAQQTGGQADKQAAAQNPPQAFTFKSNTLTIAYLVNTDLKGTAVVTGYYKEKSSPLTIDILPKPLTMIGPRNVAVTFDLTGPGSLTPDSVTFDNVAYNPNSKSYAIAVDQLAEKLKSFAASVFQASTVNPTVNVKTVAVKPVLTSTDLLSGPGTTDNLLAITFQFFQPSNPVAGAAGAGAGAPNPSNPPTPQPPQPGPGFSSRRPGEATLDPLARQIAFEAPGAVRSLTGPNNPNPRALLNALTTPNTAGLPVQATTTPVQSTVVLPARAPIVNVSVPVINGPQRSKHHGLFHRRDATSQNPTRPPLMERLMGRP